MPLASYSRSPFGKSSTQKPKMRENNHSTANRGKAAASAGTAAKADSKDLAVELPQGADGISSLSFSPILPGAGYNTSALAASNWDGNIYVWETKTISSKQVAKYKIKAHHESNKPVLCSTFTAESNSPSLISGGADNAVRLWKIGEQLPLNGIPTQIGVHDAPVRSVGVLSKFNLVVSAGWDAKLKLWDCRSSTPVFHYDLGSKCFGMSVANDLIVVATASKQVLSFDASTSRPSLLHQKESRLKGQPSCVAAFSGKVYAVGGIDGRIDVEDLTKTKKSFAFTCHRHSTTGTTANGRPKKDTSPTDAYKVNAILPHPIQKAVFASVGADGAVQFWNLNAKKRSMNFPRIDQTISCGAWNSKGTLFAYASNYDWSKGHTFFDPNKKNTIFIHPVLASKEFKC